MKSRVFKLFLFNFSAIWLLISCTPMELQYGHGKLVEIKPTEAMRPF